ELVTTMTTMSTCFAYTTLFRSEASSYDSSVELVTNINWYILQSYENTVTSLSEHIDKYEEMIFLKPLTKEILKDLYLIRRKASRSEEHTSELQSRANLVCRLLL